LFFSKVDNYKLFDSLPCLSFISLTNIDFNTSIYSANKHFYAVVQWLRHYATGLKVAGSRPDNVNTFFSIYLILPAALGPGVYSASNRNQYQKHKNAVSGE
jgi:hypothetical protein